MNAHKDPAVRDITKYINRSAGQHQRRISEGTESAVRLLRLPVVDTMTDDRFNLHRPVVDGQTGLIVGHINTKTMKTMKATDGVAVGGCRTDLPIQFAEDETTSLIESVKRDAFWLKLIVFAIGGGLLIAAVIHSSTK